LRRFYKILFFAFFAACLFLSLNKTADAAEYTFSAVSASPTTDRATCPTGNAAELNDFTAYISNQSFNSSSGTFTYNVNVKWGRCKFDGDQPASSRAYAIFGTSSLCPNSGTYGESGLAYDCVKYIGSPAYSPPSDLNCGGTSVNAACTTGAFNAAIVEQPYPKYDVYNPESRTYSQSFSIPNWGNVINSSTSYSVPTTTMCQYYKLLAFYSITLVDNNRCLGMSIGVSWTKNYYAGTVQTNKRTLDYSTTSDPTVNNAKITLSHSGQCSSPWSSSSTEQSWKKTLLVNPCDSSKNIQGDYNNIIEVPTDYKVSRVQLSGGDTSGTAINCTGDGNTGICSLAGVRVASGTYTYVDWFLEKIPVPIPYYPWLQTKNGNVTSADNSIDNGKITGQKIGSATDPNNRRGARRAGAGTAESSFVVAASNPAGNYFCSTNYMTLGQLWANRDNLDDLSCKTGGYTPSPVNFDKVEASVSKAYADNGNGVAKSPATPNACSPKYATSAVAAGTQPSPILGLGCPNGGIQKIGVQTDTVTLSGPLTVNGRGTLWIPGKLVIINDIKYGTSTTNDPKTTPNLVIFVEGDVEIAPNVLQIDASIISMKTISTCSQSTVSTRACENKLVINGFLASDKKINFARRFYNQATPSPAELINLTSQSTTFPAPGLDRTDTDVTSKLQINSGELAPRLR
jgi:hypothetical protein